MRADQQVYIVHDVATKTIRWIDPSLLNLMRETGLTFNKKDALARTRVGLAVDLTVNGVACELYRYDMQTGDRSFFEVKNEMVIDMVDPSA